MPPEVMPSKWEKQLWLGCCVCVARPPSPRRAEVVGLQKEDTVAQRFRRPSDCLILTVSFHRRLIM